MAGRIVVGVDGSEGAAHALEWAATEARLRQATLEVVVAWTYPSATQPPMSHPPISDEQLAREGDAVIDHTLSLRDIDVRGVDIQRKVVAGLPQDVLVNEARGALMVVVGARGLTGLKSVLVGSTSKHVIQHAPCPVLVVRA
jgi:nucleotide-binding universal stress UspA family protein